MVRCKVLTPDSEKANVKFEALTYQAFTFQSLEYSLHFSEEKTIMHKSGKDVEICAATVATL